MTDSTEVAQCEYCDWIAVGPESFGAALDHMLNECHHPTTSYGVEI